jgi:hypothetical protein
MSKLRTTHPRYIPPILWALAFITVVLLSGAALLLLARMWSHIG